MNQAEELIEDPTPEITDVMEDLKQASEASGSMTRADYIQEDDSTLVISSFQGSEPELHAFAPGEEPVVNPPVLEGAVPQGIQDDGTNAYDQTGPPEGLIDVKNEDM